VQQLLILAEASEPQNYRLQPVDPATAMQEVLDYMAPVAEQQAVELRLLVDADAHEWLADQGPGVAPEHLARIFERFWRSKERREDGAGLGLSICHEIATPHGWTLVAQRGAAGLEITARMRPPSGP